MIEESKWAKWRKDLQTVGGWDNGMVAVPAMEVRKMIEAGEQLEADLARLSQITYESIADEKAVMSLGHKWVGMLPGDTIGGVFGKWPQG